MYAVAMGDKAVQYVPGACSLVLEETKCSPWHGLWLKDGIGVKAVSGQGATTRSKIHQTHVLYTPEMHSALSLVIQPAGMWICRTGHGEFAPTIL